MEVTVIIKYIIAVISVCLIVAILLQNNEGGLGTVLGGGSSGGESYRSKRGLEAVLYNGTIILTILLVVLSIALALLNV